jgi:hypothetical protein
MAWVSATQTVVVVEPLVLPAGADAKVGGKPTAAADVDVDEGGWWDEEHTPFGILGEHYRTGLS